MCGRATAISNQVKEGSSFLEGFIFVNQNNLFIYTVVDDISSQIIEIVRLTNLVSKFTGSRHSFDLKGHGGTTFEVTKFEVSSAHTSVRVEEVPDSVVVFRELFSVDVFVIFKIVVQDVDGLFIEKLSNFGVVIHHISQISFLHVGVVSSVSKSGVEQTNGENGQNLETESQMPELIEEEGSGREDVNLEVIIASMSSVPPGIQAWQNSVLNILDKRKHVSSGIGAVLRLLDLVVLNTFFGIGVVSVLPLVLPTFIVGAAILP